jgi:hypothetical protein
VLQDSRSYRCRAQRKPVLSRDPDPANAASTVNRDVSTLKAMLAKAVEWKLIDANPARERQEVQAVRRLDPLPGACRAGEPTRGGAPGRRCPRFAIEPLRLAAGERVQLVAARRR